MSRARAASAASRSSGANASHTAGGGAGIPSSRTSCCTRHLLGRIPQIIGAPGFEAAQESVDHRAGVAEVVESAERRCRRPRAEVVWTGRTVEWPAGRTDGPERRTVLAPALHGPLVEVRP